MEIKTAKLSMHDYIDEFKKRHNSIPKEGESMELLTEMLSKSRPNIRIINLYFDKKEDYFVMQYTDNITEHGR